MTESGHFLPGDDARTFEQTNPRTVRPWQLYLINEHQLTQIDTFASGICRYWDDDGKDCLVLDAPYRVVALREPDGAIWSPAITPSRTLPDDWSIRFNPAWWRAHGTRNGCEVSWRIAVPVDEAVELWTLTVRNTSGQPMTRDAFVYAPFALGGYCINLYRFYTYNTCFVRGHQTLDGRALWIENRVPNLPHNRFNGFMAADTVPDSFDTAREVFLGPSNSVFAADAFANGRCSDSLAYMGETCAAMHFPIDLEPGAERVVHLIVGATTGPDHIAGLSRRFLSPGGVDQAVADVNAARSRERAVSYLVSEHPGLDALAGSWGKCQNRLGVLHRKGFRDVLQDSSGMTVYDVQRAREGLEEVLAQQRADGSGIRAWKPFRDDMPYSDGPYWLTLAITTWLRETGDLEFLDGTLPFMDGSPTSVWEHMLRGVQYLYGDRNARGLCRIRFADWNDGLDGVGRKGEGDSTMVTMSLALALRELRCLSGVTGRDLPFDEKAMIATLIEALETQAWTGDYYIRGYRDDGSPYGAPQNACGSLYLNPQVWAILAETAPRERWPGLIDVVMRELAKPDGVRLFRPAYTEYDPLIGRVSGTLPGVYENGASYNHAAAFFLHALLHAGRADLAWEQLDIMLPDSGANPSDRSGAEPYVLTNCILGEQAQRRAGTAYGGWWTGTAAWVLRLIHNGFSGLDPDYDGMHVRPERVPAAMRPKRYHRLYRGTRIVVNYRPGSEAAAHLDGEPLDLQHPLPHRPGEELSVDLVYKVK